MMVLDDINDKNGGFQVRNKKTRRWDILNLFEGDILVMSGNTFHQSGNNKSDSPRRGYIGHYSCEPIGKDFQNGYYYNRFYNDNAKI